MICHQLIRHHLVYHPQVCHHLVIHHLWVLVMVVTCLHLRWWTSWVYGLYKVIISTSLSPCSSFRSSECWRVIRPRYLLMHAHILMVWAGVDVVLLVNIGPRDVQPVVFMHVVWNIAMLVLKISLGRYLMLLLDLPMLWW